MRDQQKVSNLLSKCISSKECCVNVFVAILQRKVENGRKMRSFRLVLKLRLHLHLKHYNNIFVETSHYHHLLLKNKHSFVLQCNELQFNWWSKWRNKLSFEIVVSKWNRRSLKTNATFFEGKVEHFRRVFIVLCNGLTFRHSKKFDLYDI